MAYFPNGRAGMYIDEQCAECIHADPEAGCPIALVQMEFNYEQLNDGETRLRRCLNLLVDERGDCQMKPLIDKFYMRKQDVDERPRYKPSKLWGDECEAKAG
jgi:hypothetical protein